MKYEHEKSGFHENNRNAIEISNKDKLLKKFIKLTVGKATVKDWGEKLKI